MELSTVYRYIFTGLLFLIILAHPASGFSILAHEAIVDAEWTTQITPLLLKRYPNATANDLKKAHAYAYGGCMLPDMGYMPFGDPFFTDLLHYVRSGEFVVAMIDESQNLNEYAFALGALAHYASDNTGHPTINQVVGLDFPKLRKKYGDCMRNDK